MFKHTVRAAGLVALVLAGCATRPQVDVPEQFTSLRVDAQVAGLSCPLCAESLIATVEQVEGVESTWLDLDTGRLTLEFSDPPPTPATIAQSIDNAGFTFLGYGPVTK